MSEQGTPPTEGVQFEDLDWEQFKTGVAAALVDGLKGVVEAGKGDIQRFATEITYDMTEAMMLPQDRREAVLKELQGQVRLIGERNRIRAANAAWATAENVIGMVARVAVTALTTAAAAI